MKKNVKRLLIIILIIIVFLAIGIIVFNISNKQNNSNGEFKNVKEIAEYFGCEYKEMKNSNEEGFSKDIYLTLMKDPIDKDGNTERTLYESLFNLIGQKLEYENYRIIDESRDLTVRVTYDEDQNGYYTVNNINNYFDNLRSLYSINNQKEEKINQINITSSELQNIINNNWIRKNANLGNKTSICENYDIYWNNGYKIRTINNKIYNIIFTKNYQKEIFKGIKVGMTNKEIKNILGNPTYEDNSEIEIIGYKLEQLYAFFSDGEISIYRPDEYDEESNNKFAEIYTRLLKNGDYKSFMTELTKIYPDYSNYIQNENYINITYPLKGFEINLGENLKNGITIYENYKGKITQEISLENVKENKKLPKNTYINLDENLVFTEELNRAQNDYMKRNPYDDINNNGNTAKSKTYRVIYNEMYNAFDFYSRNKLNEDFEIKVQNATGIYYLSDNLFIYGCRNDGIYSINTNTRQINKLISSDTDCIIKKIENNTIYYDEKSITIQ